MPGDTSICNDFTLGPDHALYVTDTSNARIYRVKAGASSGELLIEDLRVLNGIDGITFLNGELYANNVATNNIYRIPLDANGKAGDPVQIWTDQPIKGPDGMRAANGKIFLAENRNGRASMLTINGEIAHVTVVQTGLTLPTAIEPAGEGLWIGDRANDNAISPCRVSLARRARFGMLRQHNLRFVDWPALTQVDADEQRAVASEPKRLMHKIVPSCNNVSVALGRPHAPCLRLQKLSLKLLSKRHAIFEALSLYFLVRQPTVLLGPYEISSNTGALRTPCL